MAIGTHRFCTCVSIGNKLDWENELMKMIGAYRLATCELTNHSAFEMMRGRTPCTKDNMGWLSRTEKINRSPVDVQK